MRKTKIKSITCMTLLALGLVFSCKTQVNPGDVPGQSGDTPGQSGDNQQPSAAEEYKENTSSRSIATDDSAVVTFANTLNINLEDTSLLSGNDISITDSEGNKITASYDSTTGELTVNSSKSGETLQVVVTGSSEKVHLVFSNKKEVVTGIVLKNVNISSTGNYPAINIDKKAKVYLTLEGTNTITDGRTYGYGYGKKYSSSASDTYTDDDGNAASCTVSKNPVSDGLDTKATIYTKGPLLLNGTGSLTLTENYKHGIYSKDYIRVFGGQWTISSKGRNGIQSVNGFIMDDGVISIKGTGSNTNNQSRGIVVEGTEDSLYAGEGYVLINGGTINIETVGKGITAKWDISEDAETSDTTDDPYPAVKITGGNITIKTTGTPADESRSSYSFTDADGVTVSETTKLSPEGMEGKAAVIIEGGSLDIQATDDCINASRSGYASLKVSGGKIYAYSSGNDAMDSNGTFTITGGTIVALAPTTPECAFDCDNYTFTITGGTFIGIGTGNYSKPTASVTSQSTIVLSGDYLGTAGKTFVIGEASENPVFAYTIDSSVFANMSSNFVAVLSSPEIKTDTTYSLFADATVSGGTDFHGLYTALPAASGGTAKASSLKTTSSSYVYTLSSSTNGGAQEGVHGNPNDGTQRGPRQ